MLQLPPRQRHLLVLLGTITVALIYMDRVNMSVSAVIIDSEKHWGPAVKGRVLGALFAGYTLSQLVGAMLAKRFGGKTVLGLATLAWSTLIMLTPWFAARPVGLLVLCRFTLGLLEGVAFPVLFHMFGLYVPEAERTRSVTFVHSGLHGGTTLALLASPIMISHFGWPVVFLLFGSAGFVWFALWQLYVPDDAAANHKFEPIPLQSISTSPAGTGSAAAAGSDASQSGGGGAAAGGKAAAAAAAAASGDPAAVLRVVKAMMREPSVLAICACHFAHNWTNYICISWLPTYFAELFPEEGGLQLTFFPYVCMAVTSSIGGYVSDTVLFQQLHWDLLRVRRFMVTVGFAAGSVLMLLFARSQSAVAAIVLLSLALASVTLAASGWEANKLDVAGPHTGALQSLSNTVAAAAGVIGVPFAGFVLTHSGWPVVFSMIGAVQLAALFVFRQWGAAQRVQIL